MEYLTVHTDMGKDNNVRDFFKDFADAIRVKVRDIGTIIPTNIPSIIESADPTKFGRFSKEVTVSLSEGIAGIKTVSFHPSVTTIQKNAYKNMSSIETLVLPSGLEKIEENAFEGCSSLTDITIPDSVTRIGKNAFYRCGSVETLTVPTATRLFESVGFENTKWYGSQPDGVVYIGGNAYKYKGTIQENPNLEIRYDTHTVTASAFIDQSNLTQITFPDTTDYLGVNSFYGCLGLQRIEIHGKKVRVATSAFSECKNLKEVYINDVESFGNSSFANCTNLSSLTIMNKETLPTVGTDAFSGIDSKKLTVYVADAAMQGKFKANSFWGSYNIQIVE